MTRIAGRDSGVYFNGYDISGRSRSWDINLTAEQLDATGFRGSGYRCRIPGLRDGTARLQAMFDGASTDEIDTIFHDALGSGSPIVVFEPPNSIVGGIAYAGQSVETAYGSTSPVDGLVTLDVEFQASTAGWERCRTTHPMSAETSSGNEASIDDAQTFDQIWTEIDGDGSEGGTFTDKTAEGISVAGTAFELFPATGGTDDYLYFGYRIPWNKFHFELTVLGTAGVVVWTYWDGDSWETLSVSESPAGADDFTASGHAAAIDGLDFTKPSDWATREVNGVGPLYYIRAVASTQFTAAPTANYFRVDQTLKGASGFIEVDAPFSVTSLAEDIEHSDDDTTWVVLHNFATVSAANADERIAPVAAAEVMRYLRSNFTIVDPGSTSFWSGVARVVFA